MSEDKDEKALTESDFLEILWQYFCLHASQRIQMLKLYLVINSSRIEKIAKQSRYFVKHFDKIRIIELPISNRLEMRHT